MEKGYRSENYNWKMNTENGFFVRWGKTKEDNPIMSPVGPEIMDIEISTVCSHGCTFCYKGNTANGHNMSARTLRNILQVLPQNINQIAYGIGNIDGNPDLVRILEITREEGIVPNITINGSRMTSCYYDALAKNCGAVAVSMYNSYTQCFNAIWELHKRGLKQINIHYLLAKETYDNAFELIRRVYEEKRDQVRAIVFLALKPKGPRNHYHQLTPLQDYGTLVKYAEDFGVAIGMDSCSAPMAYKAYEGTKNEEMARNCVEPCESSLFSLYCNSKGLAFPCSFSEGTPGWEQGLDILALARTKKEFLENIWLGEKMDKWRKTLLNSTSKCVGCKFKSDCRQCIIYNISNCEV